MDRFHVYKQGPPTEGASKHVSNCRYLKSATQLLGASRSDILVGSNIGQLDQSEWIELQLHLAKCFAWRYTHFLQVLIIAIYTNDTRTNIFTNSTITTTFALANSSRPTTFTKSAATTFTPAHLALLNDLQIFNASAEFLTSFYWAINVDLGQFSDQNIFTNSELLADATDIFHDNPFIADIFQNTPLSDGKIPGDGYRAYENKTAPPIAVPAIIETQYLCWKWVRKPFLLALIDITVPTLVLWLFICFAFYLLGRLIFVRRSGSLPRRIKADRR